MLLTKNDFPSAAAKVERVDKFQCSNTSGVQETNYLESNKIIKKEIKLKFEGKTPGKGEEKEVLQLGAADMYSGQLDKNEKTLEPQLLGNKLKTQNLNFQKNLAADKVGNVRNEDTLSPAAAAAAGSKMDVDKSNIIQSPSNQVDLVANAAVPAINFQKETASNMESLRSYATDNLDQLSAAEKCSDFADELRANEAAPEPHIQPNLIAAPTLSIHKSSEEIIVRKNELDAPVQFRGRRARKAARRARLLKESATQKQETKTTKATTSAEEACLEERQSVGDLRIVCAQEVDGHNLLSTAVPTLNNDADCCLQQVSQQNTPCCCVYCASEGASYTQSVERKSCSSAAVPLHSADSSGKPICFQIDSSNKRTTNEVGVVLFRVNGNEFVALLDTGASQSFMTPSLARALEVKKKRLKVPLEFSVANGASLKVFEIVPNLQLELGQATFTGDFLVAPVPYDVLIGMDWLKQHKAIWDIDKGLLMLYHQGKGIQVPVKSQLLNGPPVQIKKDNNDIIKDPADEAHEAIVQELQRLSPEEAAALVRPSPKRSKGWKNMKRRINIKHLIQQNKGVSNKQAPIIASLCQIGVLTPQFACKVAAGNCQQQFDPEQPDLSKIECQQLSTVIPCVHKCNNLLFKDNVTHPFTFNKGQIEVMYLLNQQKTAADAAEDQQTIPFEFNTIDEEDNEDSTWGLTPMSHSKFDEWFKSSSMHLPQEIRDVLQEFRDVFPDTLPHGLPPKRYLDHRIILVPGKLPPKAPLYRMSADHIKAQKQELDLLLQRGWIGPTSSPFCAPTMMVSKKQDESGEQQYRMVINYVELNKITIAPDFPLPNISTILELLGGAKVFSTLDLEAGFNQIRVAKGDRWKTAFRSLLGLYESKVMPFGLKGAPATFQANVNFYLRPFLGNGVIAYLDDILIYSPDVSSHAKLLRSVLSILLRERFYPKFSKCKFGLTSLEYLGYNISGDGISPSETKVEAIRNWPEVLENDTQVRQFLGTVNYCRMFMGPRFADIARPLVDLTKKDVKFSWKEEHTEAVRALKNKLIKFTMLQVPDLHKPFVLHTDASSYAIGGVLEQEGKPVGFLSKMMSPTEQRYSVYDQELLALVSALTKWRHLLLGAKVTAYTDHQALSYINSISKNKPLRGQISRWMDFLADFKDLTILYTEGKNNTVADALSRNAIHSSELMQSPVVLAIITRLKRRRQSTPADSAHSGEDNLLLNPSKHSRINPTQAITTENAAESTETTEQQPETAESTSPVPETADEGTGELVPTQQRSEDVDLSVRPFSGASWLAAYNNCKIFSEAYQEALKVSPQPVEVIFNRQQLQFKLSGPFLYVKIQGLWRICVPSRPEFRCYVLYQHHDHPTAGHMGQKKTYQSLARQYYWPGIHDYCRRYVESCVACRTSKSSNLRSGGLLQPLIIPSRRWESVSLDFITSLPTSTQGNDSILVIVDSLSKMAHFVPTKSTITALQTVELLADRLVRYHGIPRVLISDRDPRFVSEVYQQLCRRFAIKRAMSSAYHPQSDGQTERVNRTLEQMLRTYVQTNEAEWETLLPAMELAYNCTTHSSVGLSPFEVMIGENPIRAQDLDLIDNLEPMCTPPMTKVFSQLVDRAMGHILRAKYQQKLYADTKRRPVEYQVGDKVWVSTKNLPPLAACSKFEPRFRGPFQILEKIGKVAYKLKLPPTLNCHPVFHVSLLFKDKPRESHMHHVDESSSDSEDDAPPDKDHEVEAILKHRDVKGRRKYLVKWRGYPVEEATWEPVAHLANSPNLLRAYLRNVQRVHK